MTAKVRKRTCFGWMILLLFVVVTPGFAISPPFDEDIIVGAARFDQYLPSLQGKSVAVVGNQTTMVGNTHLVDTLLSLEVNVVKVFSPEHGFRGTADAGEKVSDGKDEKTGLPLVSLYGKHKKPTADDLADVDVIIFDIQDVGARFYTYISTMHYVMEAAAEHGKQVLILDRPNPNGFYVDGPVLDSEFKSFVGMHAIPVVHGLTVGELAMMINGEGWLEGDLVCDVQVVKCEGYTHDSRYRLPVKPSPNLPNMEAIYLYPSLCFFEGTVVSVGRGTGFPFQVFGHPNFPEGDFAFVPESGPGAKHPKLEGETCHGKDLRLVGATTAMNHGRLRIDWLLAMYQYAPSKSSYFKSNGFVNLLAGTDDLKKQVLAEKSEAEIRASWEPALSEYKTKRKSYLLYEDFE